jgi:alanyl-tRNA synthetase
MTTQELRKKFISFFANKNHSPVASSSLIPAQDPTLLFTNAGMNQFKDLFLGTEKRSYSRATTIQKCVRAGGKHNDLDQVGFTDRHLTFFEMMGNFSFGDFFKKEAISFAWEFLTQKMKLDPKRLSITVHLTDDESEKIWHKEIGVPLNKITRLDEDNFWKMGDTGPCGPCTEIFYDRGPEYEDKIIFGQKAERHVEIWNLVFMQSEQLENGEVKALAQPGVDTGMGLERLAMILADGEHVFDSPVFLQLIEKIEQISGISYKHADDKIKAAFNVVCDHVRSSSLIIADGGKPSNDGRGYVLRKIIRRGLLFAQKLTHDTSLFEKVAKTFIQTDGSDFPELIQNSQVIENILSSESQKFRDNLTKGQNIFNNFVSEIKAQNNTQVSGEQAFKL